MKLQLRSNESSLPIGMEKCGDTFLLYFVLIGVPRMMIDCDVDDGAIVILFVTLL